MFIYRINDFIKKNLKYNILLTIILLILLQLFVLYFSFTTFFEDFYVKTIGDKSINIAKTLAKNDKIISSIKNRDFSNNDYIEEIRKDIKCQYIVVADKDGIRFSHPNRDNVGKRFVGDDYYDVIQKGESYFSEAIGTLGPSVRGFAAIKSGEDIIGFVAVGYLKSEIKDQLKTYRLVLVVYLFFIGLLGLIFSNFIAKRVKKITMGLEPFEITSMYKENSIILNSIKEGIIALNNDLTIRYNNRSAQKICNDIGISFQELIDNIKNELVFSKTNYGNIRYKELNFNGKKMLISANSITNEDEMFGFLLTFYELDEVEKLRKEIQNMRKCSEVLRAQSHEYSNKLHMIGGLLQIGAYDEARNFILKESENFHRIIEYIENNISDDTIKGILTGKYSVANELGCKVNFDFGSKGWFSPINDKTYIPMIITNLIQNGIEASLTNKNPEILISLDEDEYYLYFKIEDNGKGVDDKGKIFEKGFSTKGDDRGYGLYNVKIAINKLKGNIKVAKSDKLGGAMFIVIIPKVSL